MWHFCFSLILSIINRFHIIQVKNVYSHHKLLPSQTILSQCTSIIDEGIMDNLRISHNASGMEANIRVFLIRNSSSHSSLDVNGLELPCLAATLCFTRLHYRGSIVFYENYITKVVRSCAVDAKGINLSKNVNCQPPLRSKIQPFLDILGKGSLAKKLTNCSKGM